MATTREDGPMPDAAELEGDLRSERLVRFVVPPTVESHRLLMSDPLPGGLRALDARPRIEVYRDLHFDTPVGDLAGKGASIRLRIRSDGRRSLNVDLREIETPEGSVLRTRSEADVEDGEPRAALHGNSDPARLLRALIDPDSLALVFELETMRRIRRASLAGGDGESVPLEIRLDTVTVRREEISCDFRELQLRLPDVTSWEVGTLVDAIEGAWGLRMTLADTARRAREILEEVEIGRLEDDVRASREVAVIAYRMGEIALEEKKGRLRVPVGRGMGQEACRRMLREVFGRAQGRIRILGTSPATTSRPAMEVWLAEDFQETKAEEEENRRWVPLETVLGMVGTDRVRDPRTLAALQVLARSGIPGRLAAVWSARALRAEAPQDAASGSDLLQQAVRPDEGDGPESVKPAEVPPSHLLNMELSRLAFDERILVMAEDDRLPLLERVRFLSMYGDRQDDFFGSRVAEFKDRAVRDEGGTTLDGLAPGEQLDAIAIRAHRMQDRAYRLLCETLLPALEEHGIGIVRWDALEPWEKVYLRQNYSTYVEGLVTPLAFDAAHPFPHVEHLRTALAALVRPRGSEAERLVVMELPENAPRFVPLPGTFRFVPLEVVVLASLPDLYSGLEVVRAHTFRLTRATKLRLHEEAVDDVLQAVEEEIALRPFRPVARLEVEESMPAEMRDMILRELQYESEEEVSFLDEADVFSCPWLVGLRDLSEIASLEMEGLRFAPLERTDAIPSSEPVTDVLKREEVFVHFPYHAFETSVERFIEEAAEDPAVEAIKVTLYRTNRASRIVEALRRARANGKDALAMVELKASLDEERNIEWARSLEAAGIHVVFSPPRFKIHAKMALVVRREEDGVRRYAFIGTGNLNASTAATYVDVGLLTADPRLTEEANGVFNILTGYSAGTPLDTLLVSPFNLRRRLLERIDREMEHARSGRPAGIRLQLNGLSDRRLIGALYEASQAGVPVRALVREICSLRPGVEGLSENIRVRSLMGRLLQHARIIHFRNGGDDRYYIGSADWRPRNLDDRVEIVTPVRTPSHMSALDRILDETFADPEGWEVTSEGTYVRGDEVVGGSS